MVTDSPTLDRTFGALADPTRRAMLSRLARGECTVGELARPFDVSLPAISKHVKVLERAGLIRRTKEGRVHRVRLVPARMRAAQSWIERERAVWERRFESLERYLQEAGESR